MVYLENVDQRNLLKRKGMSYIVKQHVCYIEDAREVTHVILMLLVEQG